MAKQIHKLKSEIVKSKLDEAQAVIKAENDRIVNECVKEYNAAIEPILKKHGCSLMVQGQFQGDKIQAGITIVKNP